MTTGDSDKIFDITPEDSKVGIYGGWVWLAPYRTTQQALDAICQSEGMFPPSSAVDWRLVMFVAGKFSNVAEFKEIIPNLNDFYDSPRTNITYILAIGKGEGVEWEVVPRKKY